MDYIYVMNISKEGKTSCDLLKYITNSETKYLVISFDGLKVINQMEMCKNTFKKLINKEG